MKDGIATMTRPRTAAFAAGAAAIALALSGCGGSSEPSDAGTSPAAATSTGSSQGAAGTSEAADLQVGDELPASELSERVATAMREAGTVTLSEDGGEPGFMRFTDAGVDMRMKQEGAEVRLVDGIMYLEAAGELEGLAGDKAWVKVDPNADDYLSQLLAPMLESISSAADPGSMLLESAAPARVTAVDDETFTVEAQLTAEEAIAAIQALLGGLGEDMTEEDLAEFAGDLSFTYVLDHSWRPLELTTQMMGETSTIVYSDFGAPVDISAPPADQVGDLDLG